MILKLLQLLIVSLFGNNQGPVNDLRKKPTKEDRLRSLNCLFKRYYFIFIMLFLIALFLVFLWACFTFVGNTGSVESGTYYYHLADVI